MSKYDYKALERRLERAMEAAIEMGWYPAPAWYASDRGSCCAIGARGIVEDKQFYTNGQPVEAWDGIPERVARCIQGGFDGGGDSYDPDAYAIGQRLRLRYVSPADLGGG